MSVPDHARVMLMAKAVDRFGHDITLIPNKSIDQSFTVHHDRYVFWFNTTDDSTHAVVMPIPVLEREDHGLAN